MFTLYLSLMVDLECNKWYSVQQATLKRPYAFSVAALRMHMHYSNIYVEYVKQSARVALFTKIAKIISRVSLSYKSMYTV